MDAGHGEERTRNMLPMFVTLEVSKLSGWLNADALCRDLKGGRTVRGEVGRETRGQRATAAQAGRREGSTTGLGHGEGRT